MKKPLIFSLLFIIIILVLFILSPHLIKYKNIGMIHEFKQNWELYYKAHKLQVVFYYFAFTIFLTLLPIPGISMASVLGGALFGFLPGILYSSVGAAFGNLGSFFIARYFLRDWITEKYSSKISLFKDEWQKKGPMILFSMKLIPLIPAFVVNYVLGVSFVKWFTFFWVSWLGSIPMIGVYSYAGVRLSAIPSKENILSLPVIFISLGLASLPWIVSFVKEKKEERKIKLNS